MDSDGRRTKRDAANERLRAGFLLQVGPQLGELRDLLVDDASPATRESVEHELVRMADTARALGISTLATVAATAARSVSGGGGAKMLRSVASAIRSAQGDPLLGSLVVVAQGALAERITRQAQDVAEAVQVLPSVEHWLDDLVVQNPLAMVLPVDDLGRAQPHTGRPVPLIGYGAPSGERMGPGAWEARLQAADAGALATLPGDFELADLLDLTRWLQERHGGRLPAPGAPTEPDRPSVFVLMDEGDLRDRLVGALEAAMARPMASASPADLGPALAQVAPDGVILGAQVGSVEARRLVGSIRGHLAGRDLPVVVVGEAGEPEGILAAGADDLLGSDDMPRTVRLALHRIRRLQDQPRDHDRITGLPNRRGTLRAIDHHVAAVERSRRTLTVALLHIEGASELVERFGPPALHLAHRTLGGLLRARFRKLDVVGRLDNSTFAVCLLGCRAPQGSRRLEALREVFLTTCKNDHRLRELGLAFGIADSEVTPVGLVQRARDDLLRAPH